MLEHSASDDDLRFRQAFESGGVSPQDFDHRAHLRLAYVYLVEGSVASAERKMRDSLLAFLEANGVPASKFHETITRAWLLAVRHFMNRAGSSSFEEFAEHSAPLLDSKVMLTHYSADRLFSAQARTAFIEPDLEAIPA